MSSEAEETCPPKGRRRWRLLRRAGLVLVLVLLGLYLLRNVVIAPLVLRIARGMAADAGYELEVGGVAGSWLRDLELHEVSIAATRADVPLRSARFARARVRYDLLELVRGDLAGLLAVEVDEPGVDLDLTASAPTAEPEEPGAPIELPAHLPGVALRDGSARVRLNAESVLTVEGLQASGEGQIALELRAALAPSPAPLPPDLPLSAVVSLDRGTLRVTDLRAGDLAEVHAGNVDTATGSGDLSGALLGAKLAASARFEAGVAVLSLSVEELDVATALAQIDAELAAEIAGRLTLELEGELPLDHPLDARASGWLRLAAASFRGEGVDEATVELELADRVARIPSLRARRAGAELQATDLSASIDAEDLGALLDSSSGQLALAVPDLAAAAGAWLPEGLLALGPLDAGLALELEGRTVRIETGAVTAPGLSLALAGGELALPAGWPPVVEDAAIALDARLEATDLAGLPGPPSGAFETGRASVELQATGTLGAPRVAAVVAAADARVAGVAPPLDRIDVALELTLEELRVSALEVWSGDARAALVDARMPLPAGGEPSDLEAALRALSGRLELRAQDLAAIAPEIAPLGPLATEVDARLDGLRLVLDAARVEGEHLAAIVERGSAELVEFPPDSLADVAIDAALSAQLTNLGVLAAWLPEGTAVSGRGELALAVAGDLAAPTGQLSLALGEPALGEQALARATLEASASAEGRQVELLAEGGPLSRVLLVASDREPALAPPGEVELAVLELGPEDDPLALVAPGVLERTADGFALHAVLGRGGEVLAVEASREGGTVSAQLRATEFELDPWLASWLPEGTRGGRLTAQVSASVAGESLELEGSLHLADLVARGDLPAFELRADSFALRDAVLDLTDPLVVAAPGFALELAGLAPLDPLGPALLPDGALSLAAKSHVESGSPLAALLPPDARPTDGDVEATLTLGGTWAAPDARLMLGAVGLRLPDPQGAGADIPATLSLDMSAGRELVVEELDFALGELLEARFSGRADVALAPREWLEGAASPPLSEAHTEWSAALDVPSLAALSSLLPEVRRAAGALRGTIDARGSLGAPALEGELVLEAGELKLEGGVPLLDGLNARVLAEGRTLRIERVAGEAGGAPFELEGSVELEEDPRLALAVSGNGLLLHRADRVRVRGDADLAIEGTASRPRITGTLALRDSLFAQRVDLLGMARDAVPRMGDEAAERPAELEDVAVAVADALPPELEIAIDVVSAEPVEIRSNLAAGGVRPQLRLSTLAGLPTLDGVVYVDRTRLSLPAGAVWITGGTVRFHEEQPLWPEVELRIEGRLYGHDVTVHVAGDPDELVLTPSSVPPLPREDLLVLLLTGEPPKQSGAGATGAAAASSIAMYVATDVISSWFASDSLESEESFLDRIDVAVGRDVSKDGTKSTEVTFRLVEEWLASGDTLYLAGEQDVHGDLNGGLRLVFRFD